MVRKRKDPSPASGKDTAKAPGTDRSFGAFLDALPEVGKAHEFRQVVDAVANASRKQRGVMLLVGGHVMRANVAPALIHLIERGTITHVALNGAAAVHDYELARFGEPAEGAAAATETSGAGLNAAFVAGAKNAWGMGESIARALEVEQKLAKPELSLVLAAYRKWIPVTVHAALGAEIFHQHPDANGAAIGETSHRDFHRLASSCVALNYGGVVLNLGSTVNMPGVLAKAVTVARASHQGKPTHFTVAHFDVQRPTRPTDKRPIVAGEDGWQMVGHHELMIPLLAWAVADTLDGR